MTPVVKIAVAAGVVLLAAVALTAQVIEVPERGIGVLAYTSNSGELTRDVLVGQTFVAPADNLSGIAVMFATYSNRDNTEEVKLHLRTSPQAREDIRTATVSAQQLRDNQFYTFQFEPVPDSGGKPYFFFVVSPQSSAGNAVAVDVNIRDPYHRGSAYIVRGQGSAVTDSDVLTAAGKPAADVVFEVYHQASLRQFMLNRTVGFVRHTIATWDEQKGVYALWLRVSLPGIIFLLMLWILYSGRLRGLEDRWGQGAVTVAVLLLLMVAGIVFRAMYADSLPVTNDEGNYLYDARSLRQGILAGGDGYVKAPLVILWMAVWQFFIGDTILAGRLASVAASVLTLYPIYFLARDLWGRIYGLMAAAGWALLPVTIVFGIYAHTQALAILFGVSGLAALLMAIRGTTPRMTFLTVRRRPADWRWFLFAGVLLGLGVASRKSILALGLVPLWLILLENKGWTDRWRQLLVVGGGFALVICLFLFFGWYVYGWMGVVEAIGFNSAEDGIIQLDPIEVDRAREYSLRGMTPFFRESLPLILLAVLGWGFAAERAIRRLAQRLQLEAKLWWVRLWPQLGFLPALLVLWWAWSFYAEYEGSLFMTRGIPLLWQLYVIILLMLLVIPRPKVRTFTAQTTVKPAVAASTQPRGVTGEARGAYNSSANLDTKPRSSHYVEGFSGWLVPLLWVAGLVFFYVNWIKFHANYIAEFLPPLVILAGFGALKVFERMKTRMFFAADYPVLELVRRTYMFFLVVVLAWSLFVTGYITYVHEHTGTFHQAAAQEAAAWARGNIPIDTPIFTGAALVPYLSGHHTALDIAHPRWYAYEFTRKDTARLNTFLPPIEDMLNAFRSTEWVLMDQQTGFSFLMEYSEIERSLETDFQSVYSVENGSNTLTFYRRIQR